MTDPDWLDDDEEAVWRALVVLWRIGFLGLERTFRRHGLIHLEYGIMAVLSDAEDRTTTAGELAELSGLTTSHLSHRLKRMEERGDIVRTSQAADKRIVDVTLTDQGLELLQRVAPAHVADVRQLVFDHLTTAETRALAEALGKVAGNLTSHAFATPGRPRRPD